MAITKSQISVYKIRGHESGFGWADIAIDDGWLEPDSRIGPQNCFRISISSDYGNWAFFWSHPGNSWREFLLRVQIDYVAGKFGTSHWFDVDATVKHLKKGIAEKCRELGSVSVGARAAFEAIESVAGDAGGNKDLFFNLLHHSEWANFWGEYWYDTLHLCTNVEPAFREFWEGPWQDFLTCLREELDGCKAA